MAIQRKDDSHFIPRIKEPNIDRGKKARTRQQARFSLLFRLSFAAQSREQGL